MENIKNFGSKDPTVEEVKEMMEKLSKMKDEAERKLKEQENFNPGEKEKLQVFIDRYNVILKKIGVFYMNPDQNREN